MTTYGIEDKGTNRVCTPTQSIGVKDRDLIIPNDIHNLVGSNTLLENKIFQENIGQGVINEPSPRGRKRGLSRVSGLGASTTHFFKNISLPHKKGILISSRGCGKKSVVENGGDGDDGGVPNKSC